MMKKQTAIKLLLVYIVAFVLNVAWEFLHSLLYISYQGGVITDLLLVRAAFVDAAIILVLVVVARTITTSIVYTSLLIVAGGLLVAIGIELWALQTVRWVYGPLMPIIPLIKTGLTPTVQLALTGYIVKKAVFDIL